MPSPRRPRPGPPNAFYEAIEHIPGAIVSCPAAPRGGGRRVDRTREIARAWALLPRSLGGFMRKAIPWMLGALALFVALLVAITEFVDEDQPLRGGRRRLLLHGPGTPAADASLRRTPARGEHSQRALARADIPVGDPDRGRRARRAA